MCVYLAVCIFPSIELNENLFSRFSQNETIAQTLNSLIQVLKQQRWKQEQLSGPQPYGLSGSFEAQAEQ